MTLSGNRSKASRFCDFLKLRSEYTGNGGIRVKLFPCLSASALSISLIAPDVATAQTPPVVKTPCEVQGDLWRGDLAARIAGKKGRAKPEVNLWWGHSYSGIPTTVEDLESWIARNPNNICTPDAQWWLGFRRTEREEAARRDAVTAQARADRLAMLRANPTAGASDPKFARAPSISTQDLPRRNPGGTVGYELGVDEVGAVTTCMIVSGANPDLDRATCSLLRRRARFDPARDEKGMPIASKFRNKVVWPASEF